MKKTSPVKEHILVPAHVKLSQEEKKKVLEKYNILLQQLPSIKSTDPAILNIKTEKNDVIKVIRKSPTSGEHIFYRRVV